MGTWKVPYTVPRFTDAEFEQMKADYVSKYGYTVFVPGWEDIVHMPLDNRLTSTEETHYAAKDWKYFTTDRINEILQIKYRRKQQYLRLLGSPQPHILRNRGSILVALDNNQDALSTLSMIIRIAYSVVPLVWKRLLIGPVGWIMTASDILNLCTFVMTPERAAIRTKRIKDAITDKNPFSKKARLKRSMKLFRQKISTGTVIEALQTTDQVFGYGISLGAIMNLPFDLFFGNVRTLSGEKVTILKPMDSPNFWSRQAGLAWKSLTTLFTTNKIFDVAEALPMLILSHLTAIAFHGIMPSLDPNHKIVNLDQYMVKALEPKKTYLREIMEESGDDPDGFTGWPVTGTEYASCTQIVADGYKTSADHFTKFCTDNPKDLSAMYGAMRAVDAALFTLETLGGPGAVEYDYTSSEKITHALLNAGYRLPWFLTNTSFNYNENYEDYAGDIQDSDKTKISIPFFQKGGLYFFNEASAKAAGFSYTPVTLTPPSSNDLAAYLEHRTHSEIRNSRELGIQTDNIKKEFMQKTTEYLKDYDSEGNTPTIPQFKQFIKDNFNLELPFNPVTEDSEETPLPAPTLPTPTEIPQ